ALARMWATAATGGRERRAAQQLADLVADPGGLDFAVEFVDRVARPEDPTAAARALGSLDARYATFLSALDRRLLGAGRALAPHVPKIVVPAARRRYARSSGTSSSTPTRNPSPDTSPRCSPPGIGSTSTSSAKQCWGSGR